MQHRTPALARAVLLISAATMLTRPAATAGGSLYVPLTVKERVGVARTSQIVQCGIPLPRGAQIISTEGLSIIDATNGQVVEADFCVTARWGGGPSSASRPIKWLLATFPCSVSANGTSRFALVDYRPGSPSTTIVFDRSNSSYWVVDTGAARFEVATSGFNLFRRVVVAGVEIVGTSSSNGPYYTNGGSTYYAAAATGGSALSVFRQGDRGQTLTLKVRGSHRTYSNRNDDDIDFNTFLTFTAGSSVVRLQHTVQNNRDWVALENNADFRNIGSPNSVYADEIGLRLALNLGSSPQYTLRTAASGTTYSGSLDSTVAVYQDNSGDSNWDMWISRRSNGNNGVDPVSNPIYGPQAYVRSDLRGFEVTRGGSRVGTGYKMTGYLDATGSGGGVTVAVRDFWQNFPKALRITAAGVLQVALFPEEFRARHALRVGEQKTHDMLLYFHGPSASDVSAIGNGFTKPLIALADPSWYAETCRVVPAVSTAASSAYRFDTVPANPNALCPQPDVTPQEWDRYMTRHIEGPGADDNSCAAGQSDYAFNGLDEAVPDSQMYSWMDYGDIPIDFESQAGCGGAMRSVTGQYGWKYDGDFGLLMNFLRSGDYRFFDYGLAAAEFVADVSILHHGRQSGRGIDDFRDGGMFGHEQHNDDGDVNPHRNGNPQVCDGGGWNGTPTADMIYGAAAMSLAYYLTGEPQFTESIVDLAEWTVHVVNNWGLDTSRSAGNSLRTLAWAYSFTGDSSYMISADFVVSSSVVFKSPMGAGSNEHLAFDALGLWAWFLREDDDTRQDDLLAAVTAAAGLNYDDYISDVCRADVHAWAAMLLPRNKNANLGMADQYFANGVRNPAWTNSSFGIGRVWQVKEWVYSLRGSEAYQLATYDASGGPKFAPAAWAVTPRGGASNQNTPPVAMIAGGSTRSGATGEPLTFDGSESSDAETAAGSLSYLWDFGDGMTATGLTAVHTFEEAATRTVRLYVSDGEGVGLASQAVEIAFTNHAPAAVAGPDRSAPVGVSIQFDGSGSSDPDGQALTYTWDFGDDSSTTGVTASHSYATAGTYTVTLSVSDGSLGGSDAAVVTVNPVAGSSSTVSFQDGVNAYSGTTDTRLWSKAPTINYGAEAQLFVCRQDYPELNSLVRFDLSSIPDGARIDNAVLTLTVADDSTPGPVHVHRVTTGPWIEGTGCCTSDGATWKTYDGTHAWIAQGGDFGSSEVSFGAPAAGQSVEVTVTSIVQPWTLGTPNYGFALTLDQSINYNCVCLHASEATAVSMRPKLTITYTPLASGGGGVRGDANGDGSVSASDVIYLINHLFAGGAAPTTTCGGDANNDGAVSASDVIFLINYLFAAGTAPAACQ